MNYAVPFSFIFDCLYMPLGKMIVSAQNIKYCQFIIFTGGATNNLVKKKERPVAFDVTFY